MAHSDTNISNMSAPTVSRQIESYNLLKNLLCQFRATLDPHLDERSLSSHGVDVFEFDLQHETDREGLYFLPITHTRLQHLDRRPNVDVDFDSPRGRCRIQDAIVVDDAIAGQLFSSKDDADGFQANELSPWRLRRQVDPTHSP